MKQVYELKHDVDFLTLLWKNESDFDLFHDFVAPGIEAPIIDKPISVQWAIEDTFDKREKSDFSGISAAFPVITLKAYNYLMHLLEEVCQPIMCSDGIEEFVVLNILNKIDALDEQASTVTYLNGEILELREPVLKPMDYSETFIFKLKTVPRGGIFVNQAFVEIANSNELSGFEFCPVLVNPA
jgi:hypothetical protein